MSAPVRGPYPHVSRDESSAVTYQSKLHGSVTVHDPYSALEAPSNDSAATKAFVLSQNEFSRSYLDENPDRQTWLELLKRNWSYKRFTAPKHESDGHYYFDYNDGLQAQTPLYRVKVGEEDSILTENGPGGELFFDPNLLSLDGVATLTGATMSPCGKYWAYGVSEHGNDWMSIYVQRTSSPHQPSQEKGRDPGRMDDVVEHNRMFFVYWTSDSKGFFYSRWPPEENQGNGNAPGLNCKVYYHWLGKDQDNDTLIHEDAKHPGWFWNVQVAPSGQYALLVGTRDSSFSQLAKVADLHASDIGANIQWTTIHDSWKARFLIIGNDKALIYFLTNFEAENYKIVTFDFHHPEMGFTTLVTERPHSVLLMANIYAKDRLVLVYLHNAIHEIHVHDLNTGKWLHQIFKEFSGQFATVSGGREDNEMFISYSDFISPGTIYRYKFNEDMDNCLLFRTMKIDALDLNDFVTESKYYPSKDGTLVHIFITHPEEVLPDGKAPVLMYGYGGFSIPMYPTFSISNLLFCKTYRGMYVVPNIRGGSEFGESWHREGMLDKKQNGFDDFQSAAEWLIANKYAKKGCVAIRGGSNGGILTTACTNQTPELFGCVITIAGIFDMLRFPKFTFGALLRGEYGDPENPEDFDYIYKYSPYHNIPLGDVTMPPMLFFHSDYDDRAPPLHTYKHVAALQHRFPTSRNPIILRLDLSSGHWSGKVCVWILP
ncbi:prolyl oligopeptidase [Lentinula aciculospora]|uniref:Prolyl endopeptidase n=1 Tax=Lentinula aciculospora TaxID=153920 RepID=A0A9W9DIA8_9AGAR|nr:prolyl oligopeptidase [Lentinula aciculospora]